MNRIQLATFAGHTGILRRLLNQNPKDIEATDDKGRTPLLWAAMLGYSTATRGLINEGANFNCQTKVEGNVIQVAAYRGYVEIVDQLLQAGADPNARSGRF